MRTTLIIAAAAVLASVLGCQASSPRGGGEAKGEGFKVVVPTADVQVKQGEIRSISLSIQRDEYFKRDVRLDVKPSNGIDANPRKVVIKASDKPDAQIRIAIPKDAALGDYRVYVKGTPENGQPTSVEFKVKVVAP